METFEAIESRRAIKHYDPTHKLTPAEEKKLLGAALLSPTAFNIQQWRFVVVRDMELRKQIRAVAWDQAQVTAASLLVVVDAHRASTPPRASPGAKITSAEPTVSRLTAHYSS